MRLDIFNSAVKEIVLTAVAALFLFSVLAMQDADAAGLQTHGIAANAIERDETLKQNTLSKKTLRTSALINNEALVKNLEQDAIESELLLALIDAQFKAEKISAREFLTATVKFYDIQEALQQAELNLTIAKGFSANLTETNLANTK